MRMAQPFVSHDRFDTNLSNFILNMIVMNGQRV
jgi:hypothetical protein